MYKEKYELRKVKEPPHPGKNYCVSHYKPIENNSCLALAGQRYFETQAEAEAFLQAQEARLLKRKGAKV